MVALYSVTLFVGALLLFLVQPMIAKMALPLLGGSPSVWNACMVFFQIVLLAGYAYAHFAPRWLGIRRHAAVHLAVLAFPALLLPIKLWSRTPSVEHPVPWLFALLLFSVGAPAFAIAAAAPLLQRWFAASGHAASRDPYFLYVASNAGSMVALLGYPLLIEPHLRLGTQDLLWSLSYGVLVLLTAASAVMLWRRRDAASVGQPGEVIAAPAAAAAEPDRPRRRWWVAYAFIPSSLMLGVTTYLTTDVAPVPLLWLLPLAIYLLTFILAFSQPPRWLGASMKAALPVAIVLLIVTNPVRFALPLAVTLLLHLFALFVAAMVCHGELAESRPATRDLTSFYLWLSAGGALGGMFNALAAPLIFPRVIEYPLVLALPCLLLALSPASLRAAANVSVTRRAAKPARRASVAASEPSRRWNWAWGVFGAAAALVFLAQSFGGDPRLIPFSERNFFGVHRVKLDPVHRLIGLQHGTTVHGMQSTDPARRDQPIGYYFPTGPVGRLFASWRPHHRGRPFAVIGLGIGSLSCYADSGESLTFYELDPDIVRLARDTTYFTRLSDAERRGVRLRIVLGDARLELQRSRDRYALLMLDAFNSDALPTHLITREALEMYLDHLDPDGVLAVHISSRYFHLEPELAALAHDTGLFARIDEDHASDPAERDAGKVASRWVVLARHADDLGPLEKDAAWRGLVAEHAVGEWTDDYCNLPAVIDWGGSGEQGAHFPMGDR